MTTALITPVHGRAEHLDAQQAAITRLDPPPDHRIVVAMADPDAAERVRGAASVVVVAAAPDGLPLAAGRNAGAAAALAAGADLLVFLDVDCLPAPRLLHHYAQAAAATPSALLCGPVAYLPPPPPTGYDLDRLAGHPFHPARPAPAPGELVSGGDHQLFWSLSFAVTAESWTRIGGFHPGYTGYGAEDTDFALLARQAGLGVTWVGGADAYHQWHPGGTPPVRHLVDILRNGALFARRWGWWPMGGWLAQFEALGLVQRTPDGGWAAISEPLVEPAGRSR